MIRSFLALAICARVPRIPIPFGIMSRAWRRLANGLLLSEVLGCLVRSRQSRRWAYLGSYLHLRRQFEARSPVQRWLERGAEEGAQADVVYQEDFVWIPELEEAPPRVRAGVDPL